MSHLPEEPEFQQAVEEIASTLKPFLEKHPEYSKALEIAQIPERVVQFRVLWENDKGEIQANRGYRVQFNSAIGPYKGGLRFHPTVNLSILKFLGFEQTFKNALTGLAMGGGKGGADFDPKGKSDGEIRKFCVAFMGELSRHIGADTDVPAGDIGVSPREIGWMFGAYKKIRNEFRGVLTGKNALFGGSPIRPEATGYGLIYYVEEMLKVAPAFKEKGFKGTKSLISGSGNVAQYAAVKLIEYGGIVLSLSDSTGTLIAKDQEKGFTTEDVFAIAELKVKRQALTAWESGKDRFTWHGDKARPWALLEKGVDIALPCATQNEVSEKEAEALVKAGVKIVAEGSNMGSTPEAIAVFEKARASGGDSSIWYAPGKASNCGGVAVSGLEMAQNSAKITWSEEEVDGKLKDIMQTCFKMCYDTGKEYGKDQSGGFPSLVVGANISGFIKVADAMRLQGDWW